MSRIKELKTHPNNNINIIDILSIFIPSDKAAYYETIMRIMKNTSNLNEVNEQIKDHFAKEFDCPRERTNKIPDFQLMFYYKFIETFLEKKDIDTFRKFCEYNEKNLIENRDLTTYTSFNDILNSIQTAELKVHMKELEKQTFKIYEDETYLLIRPLTYQSSLKYGASTKWCTAMESEYSHFSRYRDRGTLIYIINKKTNEKVACFKTASYSGDKEFSFWNQVDSRIDSLESGLPTYIIDAIIKEVSLDKTNASFLTPEELQKENRHNQKMSKSISPANEIAGDEVMSDNRAFIMEREMDRQEQPDNMIAGTQATARGTW